MCEWKVGALNMIICCVSLSLPLLPTNQWLLTGFPVYSVLVHVLSESGTSDRASLAFQNAILYYLHCGDLCMHACVCMALYMYVYMCVYTCCGITRQASLKVYIQSGSLDAMGTVIGIVSQCTMVAYEL